MQLPALVPEPDLATLQRQTAGATRERMLRELAEATVAAGYQFAHAFYPEGDL